MKIKLSITFLFVTALLLLAQIDDELSGEAAFLAQSLEQDLESEAYLYLLGIDAGGGDQPSERGAKILADYNRFLADQSHQMPWYDDCERISAPSGDETCPGAEDDCLAGIFSGTIDAEALFEKHQILVDRSEKFLDFDEYHTLSQPSIHDIFPPYMHFRRAQRIQSISAVSTYIEGDPAAAAERLRSQLDRLRGAMARQDTLVGKIVLLTQVSEVIDMLSIIVSQAGLETPAIPRLSIAEKDFSQVAAREFGLAYSILNDSDMNPDIAWADNRLPAWLLRIVLKPNMTINAMTPGYYDFAASTQLSPAEFAAKVESPSLPRPEPSWVRNYLGHRFLDSLPDFSPYAGRLFDLDVKIALFNQIHHLKLEPSAMHNPYFGLERPRLEDGKLCFDGPLEDSKSLRCLRINAPPGA